MTLIGCCHLFGLLMQHIDCGPVLYLAQHHADLLGEFQKIAEIPKAA